MVYFEPIRLATMSWHFVCVKKYQTKKIALTNVSLFTWLLALNLWPHQVKVAITHHSLQASGESWQVAGEKPLVFVLDQPKDTGSKDSKKGKKKKRQGFNIKNFGSVVDISKMKDARRFVIGWRVRQFWGNKHIWYVWTSSILQLIDVNC